MPSTIAVVTDLIFSTKITGTGKVLNKPVLVARTLDRLREHLDAAATAGETVPLVLVDLNSAGLDTVEAVRQAKGHASKPRRRRLSFPCGSGISEASTRRGGGSGIGAEWVCESVAALAGGGVRGGEDDVNEPRMNTKNTNGEFSFVFLVFIGGGFVSIS